MYVKSIKCITEMSEKHFYLSFFLIKYINYFYWFYHFITYYKFNENNKYYIQTAYMYACITVFLNVLYGIVILYRMLSIF